MGYGEVTAAFFHILFGSSLCVVVGCHVSKQRSAVLRYKGTGDAAPYRPVGGHRLETSLLPPSFCVGQLMKKTEVVQQKVSATAVPSIRYIHEEMPILALFPTQIEIVTASVVADWFPFKTPELYNRIERVRLYAKTTMIAECA